MKDAGGTKIGTVKDLVFAVAQGGRGFVPEQLIVNEPTSAPNPYYFTPGFYFKPAHDFASCYSDMAKYYDYSDLYEKHKIGTITYGTDYANNKTFGIPVFIFPNNHVIGDSKSTGFKKANTAYVLIKGKFVPNENVKFADEEKWNKIKDNKEKVDAFKEAHDGKTFDQLVKEDGAKNGAGTFYRSKQGIFYKLKQSAVDENMGGSKTNVVMTYKGGAVYYYAWLNPDNPSKALNSPVLRNNVYHVHIRSIKAIGHNWNPLFPDDPKNPNPNNPDPNPDKDVTPPIYPDDNLSDEDVYISVEVTVLDWDTHSYEVDLDI